MMNFSFDFKDPFFPIHQLEFGFRIFTTENVYGPDPEKTRIIHANESIRIESNGIFWAGQQRKCAGRIVVQLRKKIISLYGKLKLNIPSQ